MMLLLERINHDAVCYVTQAFPVVYDLLVPKMSQVLQNSQNQQIIDACLAIMKSIFSPEMQNSKNRLTKDYLHSKVGFQGIFDSDSFQVRETAPASCSSRTNLVFFGPQKPASKTDLLTKIACQVLDTITQV